MPQCPIDSLKIISLSGTVVLNKSIIDGRVLSSGGGGQVSWDFIK